MSVLTPAEVLYDGAPPPAILPCCDHYAGSEKLMRKSLALQTEMGPVFDVTLDCEDGAAVGREAEHAELIAELLGSDDTALAGSACASTIFPTRTGATMCASCCARRVRPPT